MHKAIYGQQHHLSSINEWRTDGNNLILLIPWPTFPFRLQFYFILCNSSHLDVLSADCLTYLLANIRVSTQQQLSLATPPLSLSAVDKLRQTLAESLSKPWDIPKLYHPSHPAYRTPTTLFIPSLTLIARATRFLFVPNKRFVIKCHDNSFVYCNMWPQDRSYYYYCYY